MIDPAVMRRCLVEEEPGAGAALRRAIAALPVDAREKWVDDVFEIRSLDEDGPDLPRGCVPYLPCAVDVLLRVVDGAAIDATDVFVDVGSGAGRALALVHALTGATAIGVEVQATLVERARALTARWPRVTTLHGDVLAGAALPVGTVYFFYCPFSGEKFERCVDALESLARTRTVRLACVDLHDVRRPWLAPTLAPTADLQVYRSVIDARAP